MKELHSQSIDRIMWQGFLQNKRKLCSKSFAKVPSCYCHTSPLEFNKYEWFECWKRWLFWKHRSYRWKRDSWLGPDTATKALHECLAGEAFRKTHQKQHRSNIYIHVELVHITPQFTINIPVRASWVGKLPLGPYRHFVAGQLKWHRHRAIYIMPTRDHSRCCRQNAFKPDLISATPGTYLQFTIPGISRCLEYSRRLPLLFWRHILLCCALRSAPQCGVISPLYQYMQEVSAAYSDSGIQEGVISSLSPCLSVSLLRVTVYQ